MRDVLLFELLDLLLQLLVLVALLKQVLAHFVHFFFGVAQAGLVFRGALAVVLCFLHSAFELLSESR